MRKAQARTANPIPGWSDLRHTGLLLDGPRLHSLADRVSGTLEQHLERRLRQRAAAVLGGVDPGSAMSRVSEFVAFVLEQVCGFDAATGRWERGSRVPATHGRRAITGEMVKPRHLWSGPRGGSLPVFIDDTKRVGIGRGRRVVSRVLGWLRAGGEHLALVTNGRQWRLVFAGLDYDASCEWGTELWFAEGELAPQLTVLRTLLQPELWTPEEEGAAFALLQAIRDTRKGQADLSEVLGERVREAVEILVQSHGEALRELVGGEDGVAPADIYRAACRVAMRAVVILFAESRELLPRTNPVYDESYGLNGLFSQLERSAASGGGMGDAYGAWPRILALFRLVFDGSHHPDLTVQAYGGELFAPGQADGDEGVSRALHVFETACFGGGVLPDRDVYRMLRLLARTKAKIRQGRGGMWVTVPVDFSDLSSEYIGIVYEGLLDYELKTAPVGDPVVFLAVGDRPALPLSRLEEMDDKALRNLFEKLKKDTSADDSSAGEDEQEEISAGGDGAQDAASNSSDEIGDVRRSNRTRAEQWARRAVTVARLVPKPRGRMTPERQLEHDRKHGEAARKLVRAVVLPGEWYLARWGGTRKGSGSFYTRPGLAVPTVQRTLRPLAYDAPDEWESGKAKPSAWTPKRPENILSLKVCDPACGSGSFVLAALRFLTDALYMSLQHHGRIKATGGNRSLVRLLGIGEAVDGDVEHLSDEQIPCSPDDEDFEPRLRARLRRYVVERCIYAVDQDPLAVELCRLSLWIETMDRGLPFGFLDHKIKCGNALVGAWFDQFQHYPAIAWKNREGGDKAHSNGVHFRKNARSKAIKDFHRDRLTPDMKQFLGGATLFHEDLLEVAATAHEDAIGVLTYMHDLPVYDAVERAEVYREDLLGSKEWRRLKDAMDLWCACWFWPADEIRHAPLPTSFADPSEETMAVATKVATRHRFFHWELEFPDVFCDEGAGFDAVLGNPPWETLQPNSKEFFSNVDPLYRAYGKQEALKKQKEYFADAATERNWLDYTAGFASDSNWMKHAGEPFGDPIKHDKSANRFSIVRGKANNELHRRWRRARNRSKGYADPGHPFRHRGSGKAYTYKLFLESAHALLRKGGRMGLIVPSGIYSDHGTLGLRTLFLEHCRWEWLFGIENSRRIFPIHRSQKFNPVIIEKGSSTEAIRTAFMRRTLEDWERAEELAMPYTRAQVEKFSPKSRAILEIQSRRDLDILEKIYTNSVLLGDDGPDGWGIRYSQGDFNMTSDSRLFPPRPQWEAKGYRPDEYSRWLKGDWRPIEELWAELALDPDDPAPAEIELEDWLFDTSAGLEQREAEARLVHGHLLKPGDVARTNWAVRCAQPPYDRLPVPRVEIPPGIILSRDGTEWIWEEAGIEDLALPLYEGRMIGQFDFSEKGWVSGKGRGAVWRELPWKRKQIEPQFLMGMKSYSDRISAAWRPKFAHMRIGSSTNARTAVGSFVCGLPTGDTAATLFGMDVERTLALTTVFGSLAFDFVTRCRVSGLHIDYHVIEQNPLCSIIDTKTLESVVRFTRSLCLSARQFAPATITVRGTEREVVLAVTTSERIRIRAIVDAAVAASFGLTYTDLYRILDRCDIPQTDIVRSQLNAKGFWRLDRERDPELRHTVLTLVAFRDLESKIRAENGDPEAGIQAFLTQNHSEGWVLPETLRLSDHGLGRDDRARRYQPVAGRLGPRFYDWQLTQSGDESWRERHLHARNLLGRVEYARLIERLANNRTGGRAEPDGHLHNRFVRALAGKDAPWPTTKSGGVYDGGSAASYGAPTQAEIFPRPETDLFE